MRNHSHKQLKIKASLYTYYKTKTFLSYKTAIYNLLRHHSVIRACCIFFAGLKLLDVLKDIQYVAIVT